MKTEKLLIGRDIYLRSLLQGDATKTYLDWLSDPEINRYLEVRFMPAQTLPQLREFIEKTGNSGDSLLLGIFLIADNRHIGNIKLGPIDWNHHTSDIGLIIGDRDQWGKGFATAAIQLVSDYAFRELKLAKLTAGCYAENRGSMNAFLKAGFKHEGTRLSQWQVGNQRQDGLLMGRVNPNLNHHLGLQKESS